MSIHDLPRDQLVVLPLEVMLAVARYLGGRPYMEVAPLAADLAQLTTLREYLAYKPPKPATEGATE